MISFVSLLSFICRAAHHNINRVSLQSSALPKLVIKINFNDGSEAWNSCQILECTRIHSKTMKIMVKDESSKDQSSSITITIAMPSSVCSLQLEHARSYLCGLSKGWRLVYAFLLILTIMSLGSIPVLAKRAVANIYVSDSLYACQCVSLLVCFVIVSWWMLVLQMIDSVYTNVCLSLEKLPLLAVSLKAGS